MSLHNRSEASWRRDIVLQPGTGDLEYSDRICQEAFLGSQLSNANYSLVFFLFAGEHLRKFPHSQAGIPTRTLIGLPFQYFLFDPTFANRGGEKGGDAFAGTSPGPELPTPFKDQWRLLTWEPLRDGQKSRVRCFLWPQTGSL